MLRTKDDVVRHAEAVLRKAKNEVERKSRCFFIAQLFSKIKEYDQVINYVQQYLSVKSNSSLAYVLMAQAYEGLGQLDKALSAYQNSIEFECRGEILLKICELYCDERVAFDREKAQNVLELAQNGFPYHPVILSLRERLMTSGTDTDKEEYEKLLLVELKGKPDDPNVRIKIIKLYLRTDRIELAYRTCCDIEYSLLFARKLDWYECFDTVCDAYCKKYVGKCDYIFYTNWLHCLDNVCSLSYSVEGKKTLNYCYTPVNKLDRILNECSSMGNEEFKHTLDHFAAQLSFHIAMLLTIKAKEDSDYLSDTQKNHLWFERKVKIGALLLLSIKNGYLKLNSIHSNLQDQQFKLHEHRVHQSKTRFVEVHYTLESFARNNNQGEKQFIDCINFFVTGEWKNEIYKIFKSLPSANVSLSFFMKSTFFQDVPRKFPSTGQIENLFSSFEITYNCNLHNMLWLSLQSVINFDKPFLTRINKNVHLNCFGSLNLTTYNLSSYSIESLNQLDMDSFIYLITFSKASQMKQKSNLQTVVVPSCVSPYLISEREENFWNNALTISRSTSKEKDFKSSGNDLSEISRFDMQVILEQLRAHNLQLPLIVHLARCFTNRAEIESVVVQDACEKRAAYLWEIVLINLKNINNKLISSLNSRNFFFTYDVPDFTPLEIRSINVEARIFFGSYYKKCKLFDKALDMLRSVQTPESLYIQAGIYEAMSCQDVFQSYVDSAESRSKGIGTVNKARDSLVQALDLIKTTGDSDPSLSSRITEKLSNIDRLLTRYRTDGNDNENRGFCFNSDESTSYNGSDLEETGISGQYQNMNCSGTHLSSTPRRSRAAPLSMPSNRFERNDDKRGGSINTSAFADVCELMTLHHNTNQLKMQSLIESFKLIIGRLESFENRLDRLESSMKSYFDQMESSMKSYFTELKKELKQKPDLYNMLEDEDYNPEEVLNYPTYFQRNSNLMQGSSTVNYPPATAPIPPAAYFTPSQLYQGSVPFYAPSGPVSEPQMADYLRTIAANAAVATQRNNALGGLLVANLPPLHQAPLVASPNLPHLQVPSTSPPCSTKPNRPPPPNNVVITTSDALPTTVPTTTPTLFVNIPPEHRLGVGSASAVTMPPAAAATPVPHKFQIPMPSNFKLVEKAPVADPAEDKEIEATLDVSKDSEGGPTYTEHDPLPNFKPIIPLPDEVEVKTGEEDETVIFDCRAKLFRFVNKEWKERGVGQLKILKSKSDQPQFRILMRREQVHKICANHFITADMKLVKDTANDKSYLWWAHDFADEKMEVEKLAAKFKTVEDAELFRDKFNEAKKIIEDATSSEQLSDYNVTPPKKGINLEETKLVANTLKENKISVGGFTFSSAPKLLGVQEKVPEKTSEEKKTPGPFAAFNFGASKSEPKQTQPSFSFSSKPALAEVKTDRTKKDPSYSETQPTLLDLLRPDASNNWECDTCYTSNPSSSKICAACETPVSVKTSDKAQKPTVVATDPKKIDSSLPSLSSLFKPAQGSWSCDVCLVSNKADTTSCAACGTVKPGCVAETKSAPQTSFSFGIPPSTAANGAPAFTTVPESDGPKSSAGSIDNLKTQSTADSTASTNNTGGIFTFGMPSVQPSSNFSFGSAKFNFTMSTPTKVNDEAKSPHTTPKSAQKTEGEESDNEHDEDQDHTEGIYFQPVVELPDKIDVKTGEEDETVLYSQRSKLFRYDSESKQWKERGVGDVKILRHKTTGKIRLLMRREPVMKLCLNHYLTCDLEMKQKDAKSWIWFASDFSEGEQIVEKFCIRFKTPEIAQEFKENFDKIKNNPDCTTVAKSEEDDVVFVSETKIVSDELRDKAIALKLPENFYHYLDLPDCPGCRGCENDSDNQVIKITMPKSVDKTLTPRRNSGGIQPMIFGSKSLSDAPAVSSPLNVSASTPPPGGILSGKSIFGGGAIKPSTLVLTPERDTKVNPPAAADIPKSQISTFTFALPQSNSNPTVPFSPLNSVFGSNTSIFGQNSNIFGNQNTPVFGATASGDQQSTVSGLPIFGSASSITKSNQMQSATPVFGSVSSSIISPAFAVPTRNETKKEEPSFLNKDLGISFSSIASEASDKCTFVGDNSSFKWEGAGTMVFGSNRKADSSSAPDKEKEANEDRDDSKDENHDNEEHDPYFEPIVPLPDKIELKTGEEDEDVVFCERAKLYRRDPNTKEWKERGVGQMKILLHRQNKTYRLLMRREQVHKIVCNHLITPDLNLLPMNNSELSYCWCAMNMSQDDTEPSKELLSIRFKNKDQASQFQNGFENARKTFSDRSPSKK